MLSVSAVMAQMRWIACLWLESGVLNSDGGQSYREYLDCIYDTTDSSSVASSEDSISSSNEASNQFKATSSSGIVLQSQARVQSDTPKSPCRVFQLDERERSLVLQTNRFHMCSSP